MKMTHKKNAKLKFMRYLFFFLFFFCLQGCRSESPLIKPSELALQIYDQTRDYRESKQLSSLTLLPEISAVARAHSEDMLKRSFFDHINPESESPYDRLVKALPQYFILSSGENLALQSQDEMDSEQLSKHLLTLWDASPDHHEQLMEPSYRHLGIGVIQSEEGVIYATQLFATVLAELLTPIPVTVPEQPVLTLRFRFFSPFPKSELTAFLRTSNGFERFEGPQGRMYRGKGPLAIRWDSEQSFHIDIPTHLGFGTYRLRLGRNSTYFEQDYVINVGE